MRLRFVVITDIHVGPETLYEGRKKKLSELALSTLEAVLDNVADNIKPDFVVQLGDLIEDTDDAAEDERNYTAGVALFNRLRAPVLHAVGNHDTINLPVETLLGQCGRAQRYYSVNVGDFHCIVLMASTSDHTDIHIDASQQEWLSRDLESTAKPTLVFLHHPIDEQDVSENFWFQKYPDYCFVEERVEVRSILERSGKVVAVFSGHVHQNSVWVQSGIPYFTVQSLVENLADDVRPICSQSYAVVDIDEKVMTVKVEGEDRALYQVRNPLASYLARK